MKKQGFIKGSAILMGMVIITKAIGIIYKLFLTRLLGGTGMGYYSTAFAVFTPLFAIVVSGIPSTMSRTIAENYAFERYRNVRKIRRSALLVFSIIGFITAAGFTVVSGTLARHIIHEPNAKWALIGIAPSVFAGVIMSVERGYYEGLKNMIPTAVSEIIETLFKLILGLGGAYAVYIYAQNEYAATGGCFGIFCKTADDAVIAALPYITGASVLGVSCASFIGCLYIKISGKIHGDGITRQMLKADPYTEKTAKITSSLIRNAMPIAAAAVIATLNNILDLITINSCLKIAMDRDTNLFAALVGDTIERGMIPNFVYGSYSGLAVTIYGLVPTLTAMFGKSILPSLSEVWARKNEVLIRRNITSMLFIISLIAIPCGIGICGMSGEILEFLFHGRESEIAVSVIPMKILGIALIFDAITIPCFSVLQTIGKSHLPIIICIIGGIVKLAGNIILIPIPQVNINGAALATLISDLVICIWSVLTMLKSAGIMQSIFKMIIKPIFASLLCIAAARVTHDMLDMYAKTHLNFRIITALSIISGGVIYIFALHLLCILPKKRFIDKIFKKSLKSY